MAGQVQAEHRVAGIADGRAGAVELDGGAGQPCVGAAGVARRVEEDGQVPGCPGARDHRVELAIGAGVDVLMFANNSIYDEEIVERAIGLIRGMVESGRLRQEDIDRAYRRILRLKERLGDSPP